jgi:hypothetical protein
MSAISTVITSSQTRISPPQTTPPSHGVEIDKDREVARETAPPLQSGRVLNLVA